jgi:Protein of unknown function (DUF1651)
LSGRASNRPPLSPKEAWLSDGRQVLHFRPSRWDRWSQQLEITVGELLPDQPVPLLKRRLELSREEALKLWAEKRQQGWQACPPQWESPLLAQGSTWKKRSREPEPDAVARSR